MTRLILGSESPRRIEILNHFSLPFTSLKSHFNEDSITFNGSPIDYVSAISKGKLEALTKRFPDKIILTADTTVVMDGKIYNKPLNEAEAFNMLSALSSKWHSVYTALTLYSDGRTWTAYEETKVLFNDLSAAEIRYYHKKLDWSDKAAGYAIQEGFGLAIKKIDGCYYNVMGLPVNCVRALLLNIGIDLWDYLK